MKIVRGTMVLSFLLRLVLASAVVLAPVTSAVSQVLTIKEAVRIGLEANYSLLAERQKLSIGEGELRSARTLRHNPRLEVEGESGNERNEEREDVQSFVVKLSQEFELGGQRRLREQVATAALEQTKLEVRDAERLLIKEIRETFYRILFLEAKVTTAEQLIDLTDQLVTIAEERFRVGDSPRLDVNLALVEKQQARIKRDSVLSELTQARIDLNHLLGRPPDAPLAPSGALDPPRVAVEAIQRHLLGWRQRPDLQGRAAAVEAAAGDLKLVKAERVPDLEVAVAYEQDEVGSTVEKTLGLSLSFPLPLWNRNRGEIRTALARRRMAERARTALQKAIEADVTKAVSKLNRLRSTLRLFQTSILAKSEENLILLKQAFAAGQINILALIAEQRAFIETTNEYLDTRFAYRSALVELKSIVGAFLPGER